MIPHLEHTIGSYFPKKGMHNITLSLYKLALELGITFHFNSKVEEIITDNKKVKGIRVNDIFFEANVVVSNADIYPTYKNLLPHHTHPKRILNQEKSSSALIFYWGINKSFNELDLHNVFFSNNYKQEFDFIFNKKQVFNDPTVYINITSKLKKDDAPEGCENWFVMINVPNNSGQNWDEIIFVARQHILKKLSRLLKDDIEKHIVSETVLDPRTIESKTSSFAGALYGNASNNKYAAFLRHKNFSSSIKGLYFCGGSVHPGGGIPLCLNSAKIVEQLIIDDFGK
jgi:phytoene desaturase